MIILSHKKNFKFIGRQSRILPIRFHVQSCWTNQISRILVVVQWKWRISKLSTNMSPALVLGVDFLPSAHILHGKANTTACLHAHMTAWLHTYQFIQYFGCQIEPKIKSIRDSIRLNTQHFNLDLKKNRFEVKVRYFSFL